MVTSTFVDLLFWRCFIILLIHNLILTILNKYIFLEYYMLPHHVSNYA